MHISREIIALMRLYSDISEHGYFIFTEILIIGSTGFLFMTIWKMANWRPFWKCHTITYIIEMICDWWSFSWQSGNLYEIFKWYEEHSKYIKLAQTTKITVEYILDNMKKKLQALQYADQSAMQPGA